MATRLFLDGPIGDDEDNKPPDLRVLRRLLADAGFPPASAADEWNPSLREALLRAQKDLGWHEKLANLEHGGPSTKVGVDPWDYGFLAALGLRAGWLIELPDRPGRPGFEWLHERLRGKPYGRGSKISAVHRDTPAFQTPYAVATYRTETGVHSPTRLTFSCVTYANLMMAVWGHGNCHYRGFVDTVEGTDDPAWAQRRHGYALATRVMDEKAVPRVFASAGEVRRHARRGRLYHLARAETASRVGHVALLLDERVYEANTGSRGVHDLWLASWFSPCFVSGPGPVR